MMMAPEHASLLMHPFYCVNYELVQALKALHIIHGHVLTLDCNRPAS